METTTKIINKKKYKKKFKGKEKQALNHALDIRKFEIELYWKRASYFWTFIAATFAGFVAIQASKTLDNNNIIPKNDLTILISCLGFIFSYSWFCVNKGSKYWQENWEKHVDSLENKVMGPLYKTILTRNNEMTLKEKSINYFTGPSNYSVSKINQLISFFVSILWFLIIMKITFIGFCFRNCSSYNLFVISVIIITSLFTLIITFKTNSYNGGYLHIASLRKSEIKPLEIEK